MQTSVEGPSQKSISKAQFKFGRLMREINHRITAGDKSQRILDFLFDSLDTIIPYDRIGIALVEGQEKDRKLCSRWMKSKLPSAHLGIGYCGPLDEGSLERILATGRPRIINDLVRYGLEKPGSESTRLALSDGIRSSLTCPLFVNKEPIGIVFFSSGKTETYKSEHIDTYLEIADELSFIVEQDEVRHQAASVTATKQNVRMLLHDLKSPLGVIQGFIQIAQDEDWYKALDQDAKKIFDTLGRSAFHMSELLSELAELSQLNFQSDRILVGEVILRDFVSELARAGQDMAEKKRIAFKWDYASDSPDKVFFDPLKIRRVADNLLSNAVKYSARGTTIHFSLKHFQERLYFEVSDEGLGIPENEIHKLFREFGKTSVRPTEGESSSGMGLAIAKKIVDQHGGQISVRSRVGEGSVFSFWIPVRENAEAARVRHPVL